MVGGLSEQLRLEVEVVLDLTLAGRRVSDDGVANPRTNKGTMLLSLRYSTRTRAFQVNYLLEDLDRQIHGIPACSKKGGPCGPF